MLVANDGGIAEFHHTTEYLGSNMGASRVVTEIFSEQFFAPVRSRETRLDRHLRNGESPNR
jgi:hypothetical protein